jgi:hypothetical protein
VFEHIWGKVPECDMCHSSVMAFHVFSGRFYRILPKGNVLFWWGGALVMLYGYASNQDSFPCVIISIDGQ